MFIESAFFWLFLALALFIAEALTLGAVMLFFAIGATLTALLTGTGVAESVEMQVIVFALSSTVALLVLRRRAARIFRGKSSARAPSALDDTGLLNELCQVISKEGSMIDVTVNGTKWDARSTQDLQVGDWARIVGRKGLVLQVEPVDGGVSAV